MADNDHSAGLVKLRPQCMRLSATAAGNSRIQECIAGMAAHRAAIFLLVEMLEAELGRAVDVPELEQRIDSELAGRAQVSEQEALAILSTASPLRAVVA